MSEPETTDEEITETEEEESATEEVALEPEAEAEVAEREPEEEKAVETVPAAAKEEEAEGEEEIEVVEERIYTIPLRRAWTITPRGKRAPRAVRDVRSFVARHMKAEEVALSNEINAAIWRRSINKPPRKITVRAVKDKEGKVTVYPAKAA